MRIEAMAVGSIILAAAMAATVASGEVPGIKPDPRAVASGLYISPAAPARRAAVAFTVTEPSGVPRNRCPVRGSIPIYRGELTNIRQIRLVDAAGHEIPVQGHATSVWPEGAVKFLCLDFLVDLEPGQTKRFTLEYGTSVSSKAKSPIKVSGGGTVSVDTGMMKVAFAPGKELFSKVTVEGEAVTRGPVTARMLVSEGAPDKAPAEHDLIVEEVELVESGPVQATVYLKGSYGKLRSATPLSFQKRWNAPRYVVHCFVRIYGGSARMDIVHSFGYNGDENKDFVRRYGLTVPLAATDARFVYGGDGGAKKEAPLAGDLQLVQPGHSSWELKGSASAKGRRFGGWASVKGKGVSAVIGLRDAWQQWPVSFAANTAGDLTLDIYGGAADGFLDLRYDGADFGKSKSMYAGEKLSNKYGGGGSHGRAMGLLKISEVVLDFTPGADAAAVGNGHHQMLVPWPGAKRFSETRVLGLSGYYDKSAKLQRAKNYCGIILDFPLVVHEANGLYGWVDYPDAPDCGRPANGKFDMRGFGGGVGWTNGERQLGAYFVHYIASGWRRALDTGHQMSLHTIGIDTEHSGGDAKTGGGHRHDQVHWRQGGGARQMGLRGWFLHYWLTGHNEILRSLKEFQPVPYGISEHKSFASWPKVSNNPDPIDMPEFKPGAKQTFVNYNVQGGGPFHYWNFLRWQTTGEYRFVRFTDVLLDWWRKHPMDTKGGGLAVFRAKINGNRVTSELSATKSKTDSLSDPFRGYWFTYGGDDLASEWAQLTGSREAVDLILAVGNYYAAEARGKDRIDLANSAQGRPWQIYFAPENLADAYYALGRKSDPVKAKRWRQAMLWRMMDFKYGVKKMVAGARPLPLGKYTAEKWNAMGATCYGKNGHKIFAATAFENLYTLWLMRPETP